MSHLVALRTSKITLLTLIGTALTVGTVGLGLLLNLHAATSSRSVESDSGMAQGPVATVNDTKAAGGTAIKFAPNSMGLKLVWNDEFNGTAVDLTKWNERTEATSYDEVYNLPANVTETGGNLIITGKRETFNAKPYTSGYLDTIGKKSFRFGKFEMRAKLPVAKGISRGLWPAWWMRSDDSSGELDAMEAWGDPGLQTGVASEDPFGRVLGTVWQDTTNASGPKSASWSGATGSLDATQWHTYSVVWNATGITWYVDDVAYHTATYTSYPWLSTSFPTTIHLRLNLQISNKYYGYADSTTVLPAQMIVDYVRVYQ